MSRMAVARGAINIRFLFGLLLVLGVLVLGAGGTWYFQKKYRARNALSTARVAVENGKWADAIESYRVYLRQNPNDLSVLREFSLTQRNARPQEMEHVLSTITADRRILRLDTSDRETYRRLLKLYDATENWSDLAFMAAQTQNLQLSAEDLIAAKFYAAHAEAGLSRWEQAARKVEEVIADLADLRPPSPLYLDALILKARIAERSKEEPDLKQVTGPLETALQVDPNDAEAAIFLSRVERRASASENAERANAMLDKARQRLLALQPRTAVDQVRLAAELLEFGEVQAAQTWLNKAEQSPDPIGPEEFLLTQDYVLFTFILKAQIAVLQGRLPEGGVQFVEDALAQLTVRRYQMLAQPDAIRVYLLAHQLDGDRGDTNAKRHLERADELFAQYKKNTELEGETTAPETRALLEGLIAHRRGDFYLAAAILEPYARPDKPESAELFGLLADTYGKLGQVRRAATAADTYLRLRGRPSPVIDSQRLMWFIQANDWPRAQEIVRGWGNIEDSDVERHALKARVELRAAMNAGSDLKPGQMHRIGENLERLLTRHPNSVLLLEVKADWLAAQSRLSDAETTWKYAVANGDDPDRARRGLVEFYATAERLTPAIQVLQEHLARHPNDAPAWIRLVDLQIAAKQLDQAAESIARGRTAAEAQNHVAALRILAIKPAEIELARNNIAAANEQLESLAEKEEFKDDANLRRFWLRALKSSGDDVLRQHESLAQRLVDELKVIEGEAGLEWRVWKADLLLLNRPPARQLEQAIAYLQAARAADPDWEAAIMLLGKAYELKQDWRAAEALYLSVSERRPENPRLARQLALFYRNRGRETDLRRLLKSDAFPEGMRVAQEVVELIERNEYGAARERLVRHTQANPDDLDAKIFLVQLDFRMNQDVNAALAQLDALASENPGTDSVFQARINLLVAAGRAEPALKLLDEQVARRNDTSTYRLRAQTRQQLGDLPGAEADYRKALELSPQNLSAVQALAAFYVETRRNDQAVAVLEEATTRNASSTDLKRLLAKTLLARNRPDDRKTAIGLLDELVSLNSRGDDPELLKLRALAMLEDGRSREDARKLLEQAVSASPLMEDAHLTLIQLALQENNLAEAQRLLERAFAPMRDSQSRLGGRSGNVKEPAPLRPRLIAMRGQVEAAKGELERARNSFAQALDLDAANMDALRGLSKLVVSNRDERSLELLESRLSAAMQADPRNAELVVLQSQALTARGKPKDAQKALESFAAAQPEAAGPGLLLSLADFAHSSGDMAGTQRWIDKAYELAPKDEAVLRARLVLFARQKDYAGMYAFLDKSWADRSLHPTLAGLACSALRQSQDQKHRSRAEEIAIEASTRMAPDHPAQLELIAALYEAGRYDDALAIGAKYLEKKPDDVEALNSQAWILGMVKHEYATALKLADRGVTADDRHASMRDTRGHLLMHDNKPAAAYADFQVVAQVANTPREKAQALLNCARAAAAARDAFALSAATRDLHKIENLDKLLTEAEREELNKLQAPPPQ